MLTIEPVATPRALREFIDLPARLYAGLPGFEAPLRMDRAMILDPDQGPFWKRGRVCYWLAYRDGRAVGRISAQVDNRLPVGIAPGAGMFGCLDAVDDQAVVSALFDAAGRWLVEQGCTSVFGPCTLDMNDEPGLLVEGADEPPMTLYPWHPPYLQALVEAAGFEKLRDLHNWRLDLSLVPPASPDKRMRMAERIPGLVIRSPTRGSYRRDIEVMCEVFNDGWRDNWGFRPMDAEHLDGLEQLMKWFVPREAFRIVELDGKPCATMLLIPNMFELSHGLGPAPGPIGWLRLGWRALTHRFRSGRIIVAGIASNLQKTVVGGAIAALLVDELIERQAAYKGEWVEAGWILDNNHSMIQILERFQFHRNKTFRMYGRPLPFAGGPAAAGE